MLVTGSSTTVSSLRPNYLISEAELSVPTAGGPGGSGEAWEPPSSGAASAQALLSPRLALFTSSVIWPQGREKEVGSKQPPAGWSLEAAPPRAWLCLVARVAGECRLQLQPCAS